MALDDERLTINVTRLGELPGPPVRMDSAAPEAAR